MPANVRAIRLMPNSDREAFLSSLICDLAQHFATSVFGPQLNGLRAQLLANAATEYVRTGTPVAIEAVGR